MTVRNSASGPSERHQSNSHLTPHFWSYGMRHIIIWMTLSVTGGAIGDKSSAERDEKTQYFTKTQDNILRIKMCVTISYDKGVHTIFICFFLFYLIVLSFKATWDVSLMLFSVSMERRHRHSSCNKHTHTHLPAEITPWQLHTDDEINTVRFSRWHWRLIPQKWQRNNKSLFLVKQMLPHFSTTGHYNTASQVW